MVRMVMGFVSMGLTYRLGRGRGKWAVLDATGRGLRFGTMSRVRRSRSLALALAAASAAAAGCDGPTSTSGTGRIEVTIAADASAPAGVGFTLTLNGTDPRLLDRPGTVVYADVPAGLHTVLLFGMPEGCGVRGTNPQVVQVFGGTVAPVEFSVGCTPPESGGFRVAVTTTGEPLDDDGYQLAVAGAPLRHIGVNALETYVGLEPGVHLITLKDVIPECRVAGGNPQPFTVVRGKSVLVRLQVSCGAPPASD